VADAFVQAHLQGRVFGHEARDIVGQMFGQHRRAGEHAHAALHALAEGAELGTHAFQRAEDFACTGQQGEAGRGGLDAAAPAQQQRHTDLRFERGEALAQCRSHHRFALGGAGDAALFAHADEVAQRQRVKGAVEWAVEAVRAIHRGRSICRSGLERPA
jgi:hypothetical protein